MNKDKVYYHEVRGVIEKYMEQKGVRLATDDILNMLYILRLEFPQEKPEDEPQADHEGSATP